MKVLTPESFADYCKDQILAGREMPYIVLGVRKSESVIVYIDSACPNHEMRQKAFAIAGANMVDAFSDGGPPELIMIAREVWMSKQNDVPPCEDPNRREGLMMTVAHFRNDEFYAQGYELTRHGGCIDMIKTERFERDRFTDYNMKAVVQGLADAHRGAAPVAKDLHVLDITPKRDSGAQRQN